MNRGADRQDIFSSEHDRLFFEHHLGDLDKRGLLEIHAYALMDNHFHTLVRSPGSLSDAMHRLGCEYARWYNNEHGRDGPLFRNRFISIPVTSEEQLLVASRYIHRNPLAFVPLEALPAYRWSSLGAYLRHREAPDWLHLDVVGPLLGDIDAHRTFVQQAHPSDNDHSLWHSMRRPVDLTEIERAVSNVTHLEPKSFVGARRGEPLALVLMLAVELRAAPAERLAQQYGIPSAAAVRAAARRGRVRLVDDPNFALLRGHVMSALFGAAA
jgi:REP element-mobilizing transposase RayT